MDNFNRKQHWENIYQTKSLTSFSWYQPLPEISLDYFKKFKISKSAKIIDIGGGDSLLVDYLIELGYQDITVLDISTYAIERAKERLGKKSEFVKWIVADASKFEPTENYDFWHDRAAFHFLTEEGEIKNYLKIAQKAITNNGILLLGTFSESGPQKCSGIAIKQYSQETMTDLLKKYFNKIECKNVDHTSPKGSIQNFVFCSFRNYSQFTSQFQNI
jgi:ubiquinone/menaquinone biosynthesis C-methylase UbiE